MAIRIAIIGGLALAIFFVLLFRLWALQVISGSHYLQDAKNNQVRTFRVQAPRGSIVDRHGRALVTNVPGTLVRVWPAALRKLSAERRLDELRRLGAVLSEPVPEIIRTLRAHANDPLTPVTIKSTVHEPRIDYLLEHQADFPGVEVAQTQLRHYDYGELAPQLLGYVGEITAQELRAKRTQGYALGDVIGQTGVESAYDRYLRGAPGVGQVRVDARGRVTSNREFSQLPQQGHSIRLTIDANLQRTAERALHYGIGLARANGQWAADGGALIAMDPNTGEILALASNPTYDPRTFVGRVDPKKLRRLGLPRANHPTLDRATAGLYPPGSTFKPVTALAALQESMLRPNELIQCTGQRIVDKQVFKNWDPYVNEPMNLTTALAASCDTYFYDVGLRFYARQDSPLQQWTRRLGFGRPTGVDVGPEGAGLIPTPAWRRHHFKTAIDKIWTSGDSVQLAIGQGDLLVTPLQMTRLFALIANGGKLVSPHVVSAVEETGAEGEAPVVLQPFPPKQPIDLNLNRAALRVVRDGLYQATHATYGTSSGVFGNFPIAIAGKTGTAEKYVQLPGYTGLQDQAWWCGYGPAQQPTLAVCALIENGGHGGVSAAPAARMVFERFFHVKPGSYISGTVNSD